MSKGALPKLCAVVCDDSTSNGELDKIATDVREGIELAISKHQRLAMMGVPEVVTCDSGDFLEKSLKLAGQSTEVCLVVTDSCGELAVLKSIGVAPFAARLLYSTQTPPERVRHLKRLNAISASLAKAQPARLRAWISTEYFRYWKKSVIMSMRSYILQECRNPRRQCFQREDGTWMTMIDIYKEVIRGTTVGQMLVELWSESETVHG